ncbi:nuclear transport factor 2 family protein [Oerskovia turbata]|uniref:Nuclear transport factor 2 family protein n=1 Tax=Oerskovia turbata TaxID=1713 RepID=A0A4Q1L196_9CELL|nr:nuclear transport factor 2 family protein [Oerskovia turbata]RXR28016.1 nuclear transport factor 2 family protein [Oerskovia turbata]RXR35975.1 nuclear transport factor 2 family protein [Oerskovia turbata]TGJ94890.1 nuclear transport factor 2 family protein [Actinotalea fermentans ATCC 43279 = JCM 9966 = DSM 3133]
MGHDADHDLQGELEAVEADWGHAIVANDADAIGRFMTDDWLIVGEDGTTSREDFLTLVRSGDLTHESMSKITGSVRLLGDVAVLVGRGANTGHYQGQAFTSDEWITDVFVRGADGWRCAHTHLTAARDGS